MDRRTQRGRFKNAMWDSGMVQVPDDELPADWAKMSQKAQTRWLHQYAIRNGAVTRNGKRS
jgi:hypothetical protein